MSSLNGFGAALRALRERARMRQEDLAAAVGVSRGMIGRYETEKKRPAVDTLGGLLDALDADLYDLGIEARKAAKREDPTAAAPSPPRSKYHYIAEELGADARLRLDLMEAQQARLTLEVHSLREAMGDQGKRGRGPEE